MPASLEAGRRSCAVRLWPKADVPLRALGSTGESQPCGSGPMQQGRVFARCVFLGSLVRQSSACTHAYARSTQSSSPRARTIQVASGVHMYSREAVHFSQASGPRIRSGRQRVYHQDAFHPRAAISAGAMSLLAYQPQLRTWRMRVPLLSCVIVTQSQNVCPSPLYHQHPVRCACLGFKVGNCVIVGVEMGEMGLYTQIRLNAHPLLSSRSVLLT